VLLKKKERSTMATLADDAASAVEPKADVALDKLSTATDQARVTMSETVVPAVQDAKDKVAPAIQEAKDKIVPAIQEAMDKVIPVAEQAIQESKERGRMAAEKVGIVEKPKKSHKLRNLLIVLGLGGVAAFVYTKLTGKQADPAWTTSPERDEPARHIAAVNDSGTAAGPVDGSDTAPTAPLPSEETVESPVPTTPDEPLEKKNLA
jgi:hypothetical protein